MNDNEPSYTSPETEIPRLRFEEGWREILEAPDALDYQTWLNDLVDLSLQRIDEENADQTYDQEAVLTAWLKALEQVADIAIDPDDMAGMTQAEIAETALITLQTNIESLGWDSEGLIFTVPNLFTGEEATIDLRELLSKY